MSITKMASYDLKGVKLSFADWISNLSPTETPFCSMTGKEAISQTKFQWQTDTIPTAKDNAVEEGSVPTFEDPTKTRVITNNTQIFRRAVSVSDTANAVATYGRNKEVGYQMEKAGMEIKRDMEKAFLFQDHGVELNADIMNNGTAATSAGANTPATAGFIGLVAKKNIADPDTGAVIHKHTGVAVGSETEAMFFDMTYQLYLANSKANVVMFHPKHAGFFSRMLSVSSAAVNRMKMFDTMDDEYNTEVDTIVDPLGQKFALVPNRQMPENYFYFFNPSDWTQMVLRAPKKIQLAKVGSSEQWVIEAEVGLRHRNLFASGILKLDATA